MVGLYAARNGERFVLALPVDSPTETASQGPLFPARKSLNCSHELCRGDFKCAGNANDIDQADVSLTAFDAANIGPVQAGPFGQSLLRKSQGMPPFTDGFAELDARIRGHALIFTR